MVHGRTERGEARERVLLDAHLVWCGRFSDGFVIVDIVGAVIVIVMVLVYGLDRLLVDGLVLVVLSRRGCRDFRHGGYLVSVQCCSSIVALGRYPDLQIRREISGGRGVGSTGDGEQLCRVGELFICLYT